MKRLMNVNEKYLAFLNDEDISTASVIKILDVYEVGINESYYKVKHIKNIGEDFGLEVKLKVCKN